MATRKKNRFSKLTKTKKKKHTCTVKINEPKRITQWNEHNNEIQKKRHSNAKKYVNHVDRLNGFINTRQLHI